MAHEEDEAEGDAPEKDKLGVGAGHAVALAVDLARALLLDEALEDKVERLAGELAGKEQGDLDLARGKDEGQVDDAERLREEGEVCAEERDAVVGVLARRGLNGLAVRGFAGLAWGKRRRGLT